MSRLTKKTAVGYRPIELSHNDYCIDDCIQKLGRLEDLEEQGRLIEQKHGQWGYNKYRQMYCSNCGQYPEIAVEWNYCPNCGAKMAELKGE